MENTNKQPDIIFSQIILEQTHLDFIDEQLNELYNSTEEGYMENRETDIQDEATLNFLMQEKIATNNRIRELKQSYIEAISQDTCTGKIEITYDNIPDEVRWEIYRMLNKLSFTTPGLSYRTVENELKYSKDFAYDEQI